MDDQPNHETEDGLTVTKDTESPPLKLGPQRLHYGYSVALPQAHLTFTSIVQGIAFGVLLQGWPVPGDLQLSRLWTFSVDHHAYLPWIVSVMVIIAVWNQFAAGAVFYIWPLSATQTALILTISLAEIIAFRTISTFSYWLASLGVVGIVGGIIRLHNLRIRTTSFYASDIMKKHDADIELLDGIEYCVLGMVILITGIAIQYVSEVTALAWWIQWVILVVLTGIMLIVLGRFHQDMDAFIDDAAAGSDLESNNRGGVRYKSRKVTQSKKSGA